MSLTAKEYTPKTKHEFEPVYYDPKEPEAFFIEHPVRVEVDGGVCDATVLRPKQRAIGAHLARFEIDP
jgi:hypothetical protein